MPLIPKTARSSPATRALLTALYALLAVGAATMLYPFLLMVAGSTQSGVDTGASTLVPRFLVDDEALYAKYVEGLFNESLDAVRYSYEAQISGFEGLRPPEFPNEPLAARWRTFLEDTGLPPYASAPGFIDAPVSRGVLPHHFRAFRARLDSSVQGDLALLNRRLGTHFPNWGALHVPPGHFFVRRSVPTREPLRAEFEAFAAELPPAERYVFSIEGFYVAGFLMAQYTRSIEAYNDAHGTAYASWDEVRLDRTVPAAPARTPQEREDWLTFARTVLNLLWVRADPSAAEAYRAFLAARYGTIDELNRVYDAAFDGFADVPLPESRAAGGAAWGDWDLFLQGWEDPETGRMHQLADEWIVLDSPDFRFRDYLREVYGDIAALNRNLGTAYPAFEAIRPPQRDLHYDHFLERRAWLRWEFTRRNFISVADYILLRGRAILNTAFYCGLAVLCALLVNPLAAYALSRYRPPSAYKILLLLMLTMAFPPMVTQIPLFLMLREFNLLNTFWALVLPGMAHGYSIFLLKGFFDSLPRDFYESAAIDGAGEFRIFWQITMSLSKPILAVVALNAFTVAYSNFMMALLVCQDERMWTLMPWLYQLQQRSATGIIYASLLIAALPTFLVFVFCQNLIMRGIVVPVEK